MSVTCSGTARARPRFASRATFTDHRETFIFPNATSPLVARRPSKGVYAIRHVRSGNVRYVGKSEDIDRRLEEHRRAGRYYPGIDEVVRISVPETERRSNVEARLIRSLKPSENERHERVHGGLGERLASWREARRIRKRVRDDG